MAQTLQSGYARIVDHRRRTAEQAQRIRIRGKQMPLHHVVVNVAGVVRPGYESGIPRSTRHPFEGSMWRGDRHKILNIIDAWLMAVMMFLQDADEDAVCR